MTAPSQHTIGQLLTHLLGRKVTVASGLATKDKKVMQFYGMYAMLPAEKKIVVKADIHLLCDFAALLLGMPSQDVRKRVASNPIDAAVRDAISEVFNVFSAAITFEGRTVFREMVKDQAILQSIDAEILRERLYGHFFDVSISNYEGGRQAIYL